MPFHFRPAAQQGSREAPRQTLTLRALLFRHMLLLAGIALITFLPLISALGAGYIAGLAGCHLDEANVHACYILGRDVGPLLAELGVLGWFMLITFPAGALLLLCWLLFFARNLVGYLQQRKAAG